MLSVIVDFEDDRHLWIKRLNSERAEVGIDVEYQTVNSGR